MRHNNWLIIFSTYSSSAGRTVWWCISKNRSFKVNLHHAASLSSFSPSSWSGCSRSPLCSTSPRSLIGVCSSLCRLLAPVIFMPRDSGAYCCVPNSYYILTVHSFFCPLVQYSVLYCLLLFFITVTEKNECIMWFYSTWILIFFFLLSGVSLQLFHHHLQFFFFYNLFHMRAACPFSLRLPLWEKSVHQQKHKKKNTRTSFSVDIFSIVWFCHFTRMNSLCTQNLRNMRVDLETLLRDCFCIIKRMGEVNNLTDTFVVWRSLWLGSDFTCAGVYDQYENLFSAEFKCFCEWRSERYEAYTVHNT